MRDFNDQAENNCLLSILNYISMLKYVYKKELSLLNLNKKYLKLYTYEYLELYSCKVFFLKNRSKPLFSYLFKIVLIEHEKEVVAHKSGQRKQ